MTENHANGSNHLQSAVVVRDNPVPYYLQVKAAIMERIQESIWPVGSQLPGEQELCRIFDVSRTVIRQALGELSHEGWVRKEKGRGTFVTRPKIIEGLFQQLTGFHQDMLQRGKQPRTRVLDNEVIPASSRVARYLKIEAGTPVVRLDRLRFVDEEAIQLVESFVPYALCPGLAGADLTDASLYAYLEKKGVFIASGRRTLEAVLASPREARLLGIAVGAPLLMLDSVSFLENGTPVEYYHALHRGDRSKFEVQLIRAKQPEDE